jgi:hypothetical protein
MLLGAKFPRVQWVWYVGAFAFAFMTAVVLALLVLEGLNARVRVMIDFANAISKLDDEARAMMAFEFPHMRYRMKRGEVRAMFEDTNVPIEMFRLFLQTSNDKYISPRRDWSTSDRPEWMWIEIFTWLEEHDRVYADSAAGSHSWLWKGNSYQHLYAYWMAGRKLTDMSDRVYAQEITTPPLKEDVRGG